MQIRHTIAAATIAAGLLGAGLFVHDTLAQPGQPGARGGQNPFDPAALIQGIQNTPGCLGVDAGRWQSGKQTIVAWFEDKAAVVRWYETEVHQSAMTAFAQDADYAAPRPLAHVKDDQKPIMVMATLTPANEQQLKDVGLPISQISIELFAPLPGGAHLNGRLAPKTFKVPHMKDYTNGMTPPKGG